MMHVQKKEEEKSCIFQVAFIKLKQKTIISIPHKLILGYHLPENIFLLVLFPRFHVEKGLLNPGGLAYNYAENP